MSKNHRPLAILLLLILSLIWGSSYILIKKGLIAFTALELGALRVSIAALVLTPFVFRYLKDLTRLEFIRLAIIGICGNAIPALLYGTAQTVLPSAIAGVLNSLTPLSTIVIAFLVFHKRFPFVNVMGVLIGLVGTVVLVSVGIENIPQDSNLWYSLLIVLATINYGLAANYIKEYFNQASPIKVTAVSLVTVGWPATIFLLLGTDFLPHLTEHPHGWASFGYLAILGAIGTALAVILFNRLIQISNLIIASSVTYTMPVVAISWGLLDGELLTWQHAIGFLVIVCGVYLVNRR